MTQKLERKELQKQEKNSQNLIDTEISKVIKDVPNLKDYLRCRFALKNGDRPHQMNF